jgi:hypothetical protein
MPGTMLMPAGQAIVDQSGGWIEQWDPNYNVPYYYNQLTYESTYEMPPSYLVPSQAGSLVAI